MMLVKVESDVLLKSHLYPSVDFFLMDQATCGAERTAEECDETRG